MDRYIFSGLLRVILVCYKMITSPLVLTIFVAALTFFLIPFIIDLSNSESLKPVLNYTEWLVNQDAFVKDYFSVENLLTTKLLNAAPPVLLFWSFVIWQTPPPGEFSQISEESLPFKLFSMFFISPLTTLFFVIAGFLFGVAILTLTESVNFAFTTIFIMYGVIIGFLGLAIKYSPYFSRETKNNCIGQFFYNYRIVLASVWFLIGVGVYYYNILGDTVSLIFHLWG